MEEASRLLDTKAHGAKMLEAQRYKLLSEELQHHETMSDYWRVLYEGAVTQVTFLLAAEKYRAGQKEMQNAHVKVGDTQSTETAPM